MVTPIHRRKKRKPDSERETQSSEYTKGQCSGDSVPAKIKMLTSQCPSGPCQMATGDDYSQTH